MQITRCNIAFNVNSNSVQFNSVTKSCVTLCSPNGLQHIKLPCPSPTTQLAQSIELVMPSNHLILCRPFSSHLQSFPASGSFQMSNVPKVSLIYVIQVIAGGLSLARVCVVSHTQSETEREVCTDAHFKRF